MLFRSQGLWFMMFEVEISEQADNDLREIYQYIVFELRSPENARRQLARLEKSIMSLEKMPDYMVLYIAQKKTKIVTVIRVMYGGRDIERQL